MIILPLKKMGRIRTIKLSESQRTELEEGYNNGPTGVFRKRCHIVLLKSDGRSSADVSSIVNLNQTSINNWLNRYESLGISGLKNLPGQGRKPILEKDEEERIKIAVKTERQRLDQAKVMLEKGLNKKFSKRTLQRFLKNLSADINGYD